MKKQFYPNSYITYLLNKGQMYICRPAKWRKTTSGEEVIVIPDGAKGFKTIKKENDNGQSFDK